MLEKRSILILFILFTLVLVCDRTISNDDQTKKPVMFFSLISDVFTDPHPMTMALQLANHSLDDQREVILFFNVKSVVIPTKDFISDVAFHDKPVKSLLADLIEKGVQIHVCPHCMKALDVKPEDLIDQAVMTDREKLFSKITTNTVVFTY